MNGKKSKMLRKIIINKEEKAFYKSFNHVQKGMFYSNYKNWTKPYPPTFIKLFFY